MTIEVNSNDPRSCTALLVLATADRWVRARRTEDGRSFFVIPSTSHPDRVYWTDVRACTCPGFAHRERACKHMLAVRLWVARQKAGAERPHPGIEQLAALRALVGNE